MKNILLLTDFSKSSVNAIEFAFKLHSEQDCNFVIHHVYPSSSFITDDLVSSSSKSVYDSVLSKAKKQLEELKNGLQNLINSKKHNIDLSVDYDSFTASINQVVESKSIDLIVMGSNGVTGATEVIFGSNTINVLRHVECTTLVIPEQIKFKNISEVLIPLESENYPFGDWFEIAIALIKNYGANSHILRIINKDDRSTIQAKDIENITKELDSENFNYNITDHETVFHAIDNYVKQNLIDLTILKVKKETFLDRFFGKSPTTKISNNLKTPLLVYHI